MEDDVTWAATGSPYIPREITAESSFFEDEREATDADWAPGSVPHGTEPGALNFDVRPSTGGPFTDGAPTDHPTQPGFGGDGSLSALRDAMRAAPAPRRRSPGGTSSTPGPLPIPMPRARTNPGVQIPSALPAAVRRTGGAAPAPRVRPAPPPPPKTRRAAGRPVSTMALLVPVVVMSLLVLVGSAVAIRYAETADPGDISAPMMPVVGGPPPRQVPTPPFDLDPPPPYRPALLEGMTAELDEMPMRAAEAEAAGEPRLAAAWSDRYMRAAGTPHRYFEHGRRLSAVGDTDAALYWLVLAEQEHGFPPEWLLASRDFRHLWIDPRWDPFMRWVILSKRYHVARGASPATIVLPTDMVAAAKHDAERTDTKYRAPGSRGPTLPVVIWLDRVGGNGSSVLSWGTTLADELGVVVVGLGGPERIGPAGSWWTSDPARDREQIDHALEAIPGAQADPARRYIVGAGQGAQYAVELMLRDKDVARAALALSPSADWSGPRDKNAEAQSNRTQHVDLVAGALATDVHTIMRMDLGRLRRSGAGANLTIEEQPWPDVVPADLDTRITAWVRDQIEPAPEAPPAEVAGNADPETPAVPE